LEHVADARVIFADTDALGIAYYANYLRWFEIGRVELLRKRGLAYRSLAEAGFHLPVTEAAVRYRSPARYDDTLRIFAEVRNAGGASVEFGYRLVRADGTLLAEGSTVHAFTDGEGKVVRAPSEFRKLMKPVANTMEKGG
jgi:acyl-CoA thioester hydrolase